MFRPLRSNRRRRCSGLERFFHKRASFSIEQLQSSRAPSAIGEAIEAIEAAVSAATAPSASNPYDLSGQ
jgi:hypothetical protein